ncbi:hypothetical protein [Streptomyces minutiscleroticus]|uniref:hypothetical protein n=1 Tax=Streptomyces minutiscleroticus TaxID=68238 RepID=UPI00333216DF
MSQRSALARVGIAAACGDLVLAPGSAGPVSAADGRDRDGRADPAGGAPRWC